MVFHLSTILEKIRIKTDRSTFFAHEASTLITFYWQQNEFNTIGNIAQTFDLWKF